MPTRETPPPGAPCWVDLMTSDTERSRAFYTELFGWTASEPAEQFGGYFNFAKDGVYVAGGMARQPGMEIPDVWSVYLAVEDARKTVDAAVAEGATVVVDVMQVGELGSMAVVEDSANAVIGLWQPGLHKGFGVYGEAGAPSWFELHTRGYESAVGFYRNVFGWDTHVLSAGPEFRYTTLGEGDDALAGILDAAHELPEGVPAHWTVYFGVADTDATLAKVAELGGAIVRPAEDSPYGRLAAATDPTGAQFKLVGPNEATPARRG
jgi:hypothetical protein